MTFDELFARAHPAGPDEPPARPYAYQRRLAEDGLPELLVVPTGAGKTAAAVLPHLHRRLYHLDPAVRAATPRWLVIVLPQRTLVEQTVAVVAGWLENLGLEDLGPHVLMGGASTDDQAWKLKPHDDAVFVGTQDMVVSRLLMRGYGESLGSWPISFGFLHADTQFVFDEVQLMGPALPTTLQLDGLRSALGSIGTTRSMWMSATVQPERLVTVDRPTVPMPVTLDAEDAAGPLAVRLDATRTVREVVISPDADRHAATAAAVAAAHAPGTRTIVVVNTVDRAQRTYRALTSLAPAADVVLVHSRYRPDDRADHLARAQDPPGDHGTIVVTTQVLEAGVDMSSLLLVTEACPWTSVTQRAGRCNRAGEHPPGVAELMWFDVPPTRNGELPYDRADVDASVAGLRSLEGQPVTSRDLQRAPVEQSEQLHPVLRRADLVDLFDTNPDLGGNSVDVGRWVRDVDDRTVSIAWRPFVFEDGRQIPDPANRVPGRNEICPAPIGDVAVLVGGGRITVFDQATSRWRPAAKADVRPGAFLVADSAAGGYDPEHGWTPTSKAAVPPIATDGPATSGVGEDRGSTTEQWVTLHDHLRDTAGEARGLIEAFGPLDGFDADLADAVGRAALWHDLGKAHPVFIGRLRSAGEPPDPEAIYAKSDRRGPRPNETFRHELASALMLLAHDDLLDGAPDPFLVTYLVAAHHGKVRMTIRSARSDARRGTVLGVEDGSTTVPTAIPPDGSTLPAIDMHLDVIGLGVSEAGASWSDRAARLRNELGPFRLAFLEAVVRMADWRASAGYGLAEEVEP